MSLTVGVATVMDAREVILVVTGQKKAMALAQCIENGVNHFVSLDCALKSTGSLPIFFSGPRAPCNPIPGA